MATDYDLRERLADQEHDRWSGWMRYQFGIGHFNDDGTWTMPKWAVDRWLRQVHTEYGNLSEREKESDRKEADKTMTLLDEMEM